MSRLRYSHSARSLALVGLESSAALRCLIAGPGDGSAAVNIVHNYSASGHLNL
jgi:hypothetical protein